MAEDPVDIQAGAIWRHAEKLVSEAIILEGMVERLRKAAAGIMAADSALRGLALLPKALSRVP